MTVLPAEWVGVGNQFLVSGADCIAPNNGSAEVVVMTAFGDKVATPNPDGTWATEVRATGYGYIAIDAMCVMYDEAAATPAATPLAKTFADVTTTAAEKTTFYYATIENYPVVGFGSDEVFSAGDTITIRGGGYVAGETVTFTVDDQVIGSMVADEYGDIEGPLTMPSNDVAEQYTIVATGDQSGRRSHNTVTPTDPGSNDDGGDSTDTGANDDGDSTSGDANTGGMPDLGSDVI
ncbi:MAG: hypothetical protein LBV06_08275 [Propionibacteriaceae bacterium]|nr:hypothetical protein [Propionibacteriaceae bacterium]